jgi:hypothetical protein
MDQCSYCSNTIVFGGIRDTSGLYCNDRCHKSHSLLFRAEKLSYKVVTRKILEIHRGKCPKCGGPGPVDVHEAFHVWSVIIATHWNNAPMVCCRSCARRFQIGALLLCVVAGWWGLWGIIMTPVQIYKNIRALFGGPDPKRPSLALEKLVRVGLAAHQSQEPPPAQKPQR